jgi:L-iditol 2-dehydrogenase
MMQALRLVATGALQLARVPLPEPGPGEVLVRVEAAGICGTDRHLFKGEFPCTPPVTLGHEFSGIVVAAGPGVTSPEVGTRVTCDPNIACGTCDQCRRGRINLCRGLVAVGIHRDGGFAEHAVIPAHRAFALPAGLHPHHGAFCEPLACCLHGADMARVQPGERVTVLGGGVIGLLMVQLARAAGAEVMLVTRQASKRDIAVAVGATHAAADAGAAAAIWPGGADAVIECAGVADTVAMAPALTRAGGRIVVLGVLARGERVAVEPFDLLFREIAMLFAFINPFTQGRAAAMIADGTVQVAPLISRRIALAEAAEAVANPARAGEVKVLILPE